MNKGIKLYAFLTCLLLSAAPLAAQSSGGTPRGFIYGLIIVGVILLLWAVIAIVDNLMQIEAGKAGINTEKTNMSLFPKFGDLFSNKAPSFAKGHDFIKLRKGFDIKLAGAAPAAIEDAKSVTRHSVIPYNFRGLAPIPKVVVQAGDEVLAGDVLFFDKSNPDVKFVAPVSGEIVEILRGAKRSISNVTILADKEQKSKSFEVPSLDKVSREDLVSFMAASGAWIYLNQRPFDVIPSLTDIPRDIFVSTFDTAPLAPDNSLIIKGREADFQKGIEVLSKLTSGQVHLGVDGKSDAAGEAFLQFDNAEKHIFSGAHPAGNVGVQIHHIKPIGLNDFVWTITMQEVIALGSLFLNGKFDGSRVVALTGAELQEPKYVSTFVGANISELVQGNLAGDHVRYVAGDVLSGEAKAADDFLNFKDDQLTVILEGDKYEAFGWLLPLAPRPSISKTFPSFLYPNFKYRAESNTHGEERAFVVSGQYEKVLPMDIYPQALMKSIMTEDLERMEGLGINELSEEDIALCEFVCTSKAPMQQLLREGLDMMRAQL